MQWSTVFCGLAVLKGRVRDERPVHGLIFLFKLLLQSLHEGALVDLVREISFDQLAASREYFGCSVRLCLKVVKEFEQQGGGAFDRGVVEDGAPLSVHCSDVESVFEEEVRRSDGVWVRRLTLKS